MARPIYYRQMKNYEKPKFLVSEFVNGKWVPVIRLDSLETAKQMYGNRPGFRVKDMETKKVVLGA